MSESGRATEIYTKGQARESKRARGVSGFLAGFTVRWPPRHRTAVHYFLMSNKAISMCPDQGPRVLTRVISPGSLACATSSSETDPPLLSPPLSILPPPLPGYSAHVTILLPPPPQRQGETKPRSSVREREKHPLRSEIAARRREMVEKAVSSSVQPGSKGNFHKG